MSIHATVIGNLGADPELKFTQGGDAVLTMRVAASYKTSKEDVTTWVRASLFGKRAEALGRLGLAKGDKIAVVGTLYTREHEGKTYVELRCSEVELLGGKRDQQRATSAPAPAPYGKSGHGASAKHTAEKGPFEDDDSLPF